MILEPIHYILSICYFLCTFYFVNFAKSKWNHNMKWWAYQVLYFLFWYIKVSCILSSHAITSNLIYILSSNFPTWIDAVNIWKQIWTIKSLTGIVIFGMFNMTRYTLHQSPIWHLYFSVCIKHFYHHIMQFLSTYTPPTYIVVTVFSRLLVHGSLTKLWLLRKLLKFFKVHFYTAM